MLMLDEEFSRAGAHIVCIQEGRIPGDGQHSCRHNKMFRAGSTDAGQHGSQVWIRHELSSLLSAVRVHSPRVIEIVLQLGPLFLHIFSAHAPTLASSDGDRNDFWALTTNAVANIGSDGKHLVFLGIDANGRTGSIVSDGIGELNPSEENDNGFSLRTMLSECSLAATNTFYNAGATWCSAFGTESRVDYIVSSSCFMGYVMRCSVVPQIDLATRIRDDHKVLMVEFAGLTALFENVAAAANCKA
jgi:hypothetical protein